MLYRIDPSCVCIKTSKQTKTVIATETRVGKVSHQVVYQVFWSRTTPRSELFRVIIGSYFNGELVQLWNYGIANEGDFNGDGLPDYSWYCGDDTGAELYIYLSSDSGYKRVDVLKTVEAAWQRRFNKPAPDLGEIGGNYDLDDTVLDRSSTGMVLHAMVRHSATERKREITYRFDISQADFKP